MTVGGSPDIAAVYPEWWEADVVARDGRPVHIRPIRPDDGERLVRFHAALSPETIYLRFFAPYPQLTARDVHRFTHVDHVDRVALVATLGGEILAVGRFDRIAPDEAEVAFTVRDDQQGRGLGSVLLEHLAAAARDRDIARFVADVLPSNRRMLSTFVEAGYTPRSEYDDGVVRLEFAIAPTPASRAVVESREQRSEARSIERLLHPASVAVVGAGRDPGSLGHAMLRNVVDSGFAGAVAAVHPSASAIAGVPAYPSVGAVPGGVDLAVLVVPADVVDSVIADCAAAGVHGVVVAARGFADDATPEGLARQRRVVATAREAGIRVVGPNALGLQVNDEVTVLNASLAPAIRPGRIGFFCQSGALGISILQTLDERGLGVRTFVSAGNRADVSGNDLLQYWETDEGTDVVLLYLESVGNPRKFARLARRVSRAKPIVAIRSGRSTQAYPLGHRVRRTTLPPAAVDALFAQAGIIEVDTLGRMLDVASLLAFQPLPRNNSVAVLSNSDALAVMAVDALESSGMSVAGQADVLAYDAPARDMAIRLSAAQQDPVTGAILVIHVPPVDFDTSGHENAILAASTRGDVPVVAVMLAQPSGGLLSVPDERGIPGHESVPVLGSVEEAVAVLAGASRYATWRARPEFEYPDLPDVRSDEAREFVRRLPAPEAESRELARGEAAELLSYYGIRLWDQIAVASEDEAVRAAESLGYPVVLKTTVAHLRQRTDLGGVRLNIENVRAVRTAYLSMLASLDADAGQALVVQRMAPPGVSCRVTTVEDALFGPVMSFGIGGGVTELLGDDAWVVPPLSVYEAYEVVRAPQTAPLLFGHRGSAPVDVQVLEDLVVRVARLADENPGVASLRLDPIVVSHTGLAVLDVVGRLAGADEHSDGDVRRLPDV